MCKFSHKRQIVCCITCCIFAFAEKHNRFRKKTQRQQPRTENTQSHYNYIDANTLAHPVESTEKHLTLSASSKKTAMETAITFILTLSLASGEHGVLYSKSSKHTYC